MKTIRNFMLIVCLLLLGACTTNTVLPTEEKTENIESAVINTQTPAAFPTHTPTQVPPTATSIPPTATVEPSPTPAPTETPIPLSFVFPAPAAAPVQDGVFSEGEWDGAYQTKLSDGSDLNFFQDDDYLYIGIVAEGSDSGVGSFCLAQGDEVRILHSSAALGTAVYEKREGFYELIKPFSWHARGTSSSTRDQIERDAFLVSDGWVANNGRMGEQGVMEYKIKVSDEPMYLAVVYRKNADLDSKIWWPDSLGGDGCVTEFLLAEPIFDTAHFSPETWVMIEEQVPE